MHESLKFSFIKNSVSVVVNSLELSNKEGEELLVLMELEIKHALQEGDKFKLVRLVRSLLRKLIPSQLFVDRGPLR